MKQIHRQKLQQDLVKYSDQIGIVQNQIPKLEFINEKHSRLLGQCSISRRTIFINEIKSNSCKYVVFNDKCMKQLTLDGKKIRIILETKGYRHDLETLIHELVHYRFRFVSHGPKFEQLIQRILAGERFSRRRFLRKVLFKD